MSAREDILLPFGSRAQFTGIVNDGTFVKNIIYRRDVACSCEGAAINGDTEKYKLKIMRIFSAPLRLSG
jgi:hypothetical protein